jgi:hypothetical protein
MSDFTYDFFVGGRWVNHVKVREAVDALRSAGKSVYCFIENEYDGDGIKQAKDPDEAAISASNTAHIKDWQTNPTFRKIFDNDMKALRASRNMVVVFPAGTSSNIEAGVAYGMGKPCYAIGKAEKAETLYLLFDRIFPDSKTFVEHVA